MVKILLLKNKHISIREKSSEQLGFVNYAESMHGIQIGLVNIIRQDSTFPVLPLVNWTF